MYSQDYELQTVKFWILKLKPLIEQSLDHVISLSGASDATKKKIKRYNGWWMYYKESMSHAQLLPMETWNERRLRVWSECHVAWKDNQELKAFWKAKAVQENKKLIVECPEPITDFTDSTDQLAIRLVDHQEGILASSARWQCNVL